MKSWKNIKMVDSHVHIRTVKGFDFMDSYLKDYGLDKMNLVSLSCQGDITQNPLCALFKLRHPDRVYAYGSLVYPHYPLDIKNIDSYDFVEQVKNLMDIGFDGLKMLEGKPTLRKKIGVPLDSPIFDDYYSYVQEQNIHIIFHVADPETFWDKDTAPEFSFKHGWFYGDGTFPEKESLYKEIDGVLSKFPRLRITFAHFYFLSNYIERAKNFLDKWENVSIDITPGREMYNNFSKKTSEWKDFFTLYQDRIVLGTDMEDNAFQGSPSNIINTIKRFIETNDEFHNWDFDICGLELDKAAIEKIYYKNFEYYAGDIPKKIDTSRLLNECNKMEELAAQKTNLNPYIDGLTEISKKIKQYI